MYRKIERMVNIYKAQQLAIETASNPPKQNFREGQDRCVRNTYPVSTPAVLKSGLWFVKAVFIPSEAEP